MTDTIKPYVGRVWLNGHATNISEDTANRMPAWELFGRSNAADGLPTSALLVRDLLDAYDKLRKATS